jgi:hypothetical protein
MRKCIVLFGLLITVVGRTASAQAVSFGVKGGIPLTEASGNNDESRPYLVGASLEIRLPAGFAIEADAFYRRIGNTNIFRTSLDGVPTSIISRQRGNSWEFPVLGKYYFRSRTSKWQPFAASGYAFRGTQVHSDSSLTTTDASGVTHTSLAHYDYGLGLGVGAVFAGGVRFHAGRFAFLPELRYTRWGGSDGNLTRKNEAGVLLGINF